MKKSGILNKQLSEVIAGLGESDILVICDAGLPIPDECVRVDLALVEGVPDFLNTLEVVMKEIEIEKFIVASECREKSSALFNSILAKINPVRPDYISHEDFKIMCKSAKAIVRTGEFTPYANIALVCGTVY